MWRIPGLLRLRLSETWSVTLCWRSLGPWLPVMNISPAGGDAFEPQIALAAGRGVCTFVIKATVGGAVLTRGTWRAVLRVGRVRIAEARVRVG